MLFGYHVGAAGGLHTAFKRAEELTSDVMMLFVGPPQVWQTPVIDELEIQKFKMAWKKSRIKKVLVHAAYLPNPASHRPSLRHMSLKKLKDEAKIAYAISADGYNFHCGSNQNSNQEGIAYAIKTLNRLAELTNEKWPVKLIIENDAGAGHRIGDTIEELGAIWKGLTHQQRFGFCLDTCHLFAAGIEVRTKASLSGLLKKFDRLIGLKHLEFIHINDAQFGLGSKKDRHAKIGQGYIGKDGFKHWVNHPRLRQIPFILETPRTGEIKEDIKDIRALRKLVTK